MTTPRIGRLVNRVCPECAVPLVIGDVWCEADFDYRRMLVCPACAIQIGRGGWHENRGFSEPLPEDIRLRLGKRGYRRAPRLPLDERAT